MKKIISVCILMFLAKQSIAKNDPTDTIPTPAKTRAGKILREISIGMPYLGFGYSFTFRDKRLLSLADGSGNFYYETKSNINFALFFPDNYTERIVGLYYKDFGFELCYADYESNMGSSVYNSWLAKTFPEYYIGPPGFYSSYNNNIIHYAGLMYGLSYTMHLGKYMFVPKLLAGFNSATNDYQLDYQFKEKGSNYYVKYSTDNTVSSTQIPVLEAQLNFVRRFKTASKHFNSELGIKLAYVYLPYHYHETATTQFYGQNATTMQYEHNEVMHQVDCGMYYTVYYMKKHAPRIPNSKPLFGGGHKKTKKKNSYDGAK